MSFFGSGSQGSIRYQLIVDDMGANQKLTTFKQSLTGLKVPTQDVNQNMGALANNFKATSGSAQDMIVQHQKLGTTIKTNISNFSNLAIGLSATVTSSLQLAAGFRDYNDAQIAVERVTRKLSLAHESLTKAQDKLVSLQKKGITSGKDYAQAQLDVQQAQQQVEIQTQLLGESQERLFDSQSQFVVSIVPTVLGAVGSLGAAFQTFGGKLGGITDTLGKMKGSLLGTSGGFGGLKGSLVGIFGPAGLAAAAALLIIDRLEGVKESLKKAGIQVTQTSKSFAQAFIDMDLAKFNSEMRRSSLEFDNVNKIIKMTPLHMATTNWETLRKEIEQAGGVFDKSGKLMEVQKERVIDLGAGFQATSVQYIHWATNWIKQGVTQTQVIKNLTDVGIKATDAQKIYNFALADSKKPLEDSTKATETLHRTVAITNPDIQTFAESIANTSAEIETLNPSMVTGADNLSKIRASFQTTASQGVVPYTAAWIKLNQNEKIWDENQPHVQEDLKKNVILLRSWSTEAEVVSQALGDMGAADANVQEMLKNDIEFLDQIDKNLNQEALSIGKARDAWEQFTKQAQINVEDMFGIKDEAKMKDKFTNKFLKALPDKIEKKIDLKLETRREDRVYKDWADNVIGGLVDQIQKNPDKINDEIAKALAKAAPNKEAAQGFLNMIKGPDTGKQLIEWAQRTTAGMTFDMPTTAVITGITTGGSLGSNSAEFETSGAGNVIGLTKAGFKASSQKPIAWLPFGAKIVQIANPTYKSGTGTTLTPGSEEEKAYYKKHPEEKPPGTGGGAMFDTKQFVTVSKEFDKMVSKMSDAAGAFATQWSTDMNSLVSNTAAAGKGVTKQFDKTISRMSDGAGALASQWSQDMNSFVANAQSAGKGVIKQMDKMLSKVADGASALAHQWSSDMNSFIDNAAAAAKGVNKELAKIKDVDVNITYHISTVGSAPKQAQHGMHEYLQEDTLIQAHKGERVDIGPGAHGGSGGMSTVSSGNQVFHIHILNNDRETIRSYKRQAGANQFVFGPR